MRIPNIIGHIFESSSQTIRKCKGEKLDNALILVALGANLPRDLGSTRQSPAETLSQAIVDLIGSGLRLSVCSRFFATPCFPAGAGPDYVNAAAAFENPDGLNPLQVLALLHKVEAAHGRQRSTRWAGRVLDLDLLAMENLVLPDRKTHDFWRNLPPKQQAQAAPDRLILPHPRLADRAFVLVPLAEIAAHWCHPVTGQSVIGMRDALPAADLAAVRPLIG